MHSCKTGSPRDGAHLYTGDGASYYFHLLHWNCRSNSMQRLEPEAELRLFSEGYCNIWKCFLVFNIAGSFKPLRVLCFGLVVWFFFWRKNRSSSSRTLTQDKLCCCFAETIPVGFLNFCIPALTSCKFLHARWVIFILYVTIKARCRLGDWTRGWEQEPSRFNSRCCLRFAVCWWEHPAGLQYVHHWPGASGETEHCCYVIQSQHSSCQEHRQ